MAVYIKHTSKMDWCKHAIATHGIRPTDQRIKDADGMSTVWPQFEEWVDSNIKDDEVAILVAYNGEACDMKWIWELTQAPGSTHDMPPKIKYFLDPLFVVGEFKSCPLNPTKSKVPSLELGVLWNYIKEQNLNGAHDSLVDTKAQTDIIISDKFVPFINRSKSIQHITEKVVY